MDIININKEVHVTAEFQLKAADTYIKKLNQQIGELKSYIDELEDGKKKISEELEDSKHRNQKLQQKYAKLCQKYADDVQSIVKLDPIYKKYKETLDSVRAERNKYKKQRDELICKLNQLS